VQKNIQEQSQVILINGVAQDNIKATDRGLHYGDGLFETIAVHQGHPLLWQAHMVRLAEGCERLGFPSLDPEQLAAEVHQLSRDDDKAVIKIIVTRGTGGRGYRPPLEAQTTRIVFRYPWPSHADENSSIKLQLCRTRLGLNPALAGLKHLNRLEQVLARQEWGDDSSVEGVMCDINGNLIEGTMSNLFIVRNGELLTPDLSECGIAGVMRRQVLGLAEELSLPHRVVRLTDSDMARAEEAFITNSIIGIRAVERFNTVQYSEWNPVTRQLQAALEQGVG
jgi:4-amino-4-deoxychorismate lyase